MQLDVTAPAPNPWLTMWFSPRRTIRRIVDADVGPSWWPIIALGALSYAGLALVDENGSVSLAASSLRPVAVSLIQVLFSILVWPFLLAFIGGWIGGKATPAEIRQALVWGHVPFAAMALGWIPIVIALRDGQEGVEVAAPILLLGTLSLLAMMVGFCWTVVSQLLALAEVERFSVWRAIASMMILSIFLFLLAILLAKAIP